MTEHQAVLKNGPLDGQTRTLPADPALNADKVEAGNPQLVIHYKRTMAAGVVGGMYIRRGDKNAEGLWEYLHVGETKTEVLEVEEPA